MSVTAQTVLDFWFGEATPQDWWGGSDAFDTKVRDKFDTTLAQAARGELWQWRTGAHDRLAEIIVLDQFSRQLHRGEAAAFANDAVALVLAQELVAQGLDKQLSATQQNFAYLPFMHSESLVVHEDAIRLCSSIDDGGDTLGHARQHRDVIVRFGRYPTRNAALGRASTPEEEAYLANRSGGAV